MKKMLMLVMVLGIASLATAGWAPAVSGSGSTITVSNDYGEPISGAPDDSWLGSTTGINLSSIAYGDAAGTGATMSVTDGTYGAGWAYVKYVTAPTVETWDSGVVYTINLTGANAAWVWDDVATGALATVDLYDGPGNNILETTYAHLPEPATMALLGLGCLLLRRKKA